MFRLPHVPLADELIDNAFRAGKKEVRQARSRGSRRPRSEKLWRGEEARVGKVAAVVSGDLLAVVEQFPSFEQLPRFYARLLDVKVGRDRYKKNLSAVGWASKRVTEISRETLRAIKGGRDPSYSKHFLGRVASVVKQIRGDLTSLSEIRGVLRSFPSLRDVPTLVVAGFPNSGKSTFVSNLTGSNAKIAGYPFTTKSLNIGYKRVRYEDVQVVDSPGLLDRPMGRRNKIELEAVLALEELADRILFLVDPVQELAPQLNLVEEVRKTFRVPVVVAVNKADAVDAKEFGGVSEIFFSANDPEDCERVFREVMAAK